MSHTQNSPMQHSQEDEIDLRELFSTIWRYKWFIFWFTFIVTLLVVVYAYKMPKYYKTTTVIELKPKQQDAKNGLSLSSGDSKGEGLGGAAALLGFGGLGGSSSTEKDAAKLILFRTNRHVIKSVRYDAQYFISKKWRREELDEQNSAISITNLTIHDYRKFGMKLKFEPINRDTFRLESSSLIPFMSTSYGSYHYNQKIHNDIFDMTVHRNPKGIMPEILVLNGDRHYVFNNIILRNLTAEVGSGNKKTETILPFVLISYLDILPQRGESYVRLLVKTYIRQSIGDELEDINLSLSSVNHQIAEIEQIRFRSKQHYLQLKSSDASTLLPFSTETASLARSKAKIEAEIRTLKRKQTLSTRLRRLSKKNSNLKKLIPLLSDLGDSTTASLVNRLQEYNAKRTTLLQDLTPQHPSVQKLQKQIILLQKRIRVNISSLNTAIKEKVSLLEKDRKSFIKKLRETSKAGTNLLAVERDYKLYESMYAYLLQKRSSLELKKAEALSRFRIIDPIYTDPRPAKPKKAFIAMVGLITALILAIFIVFLLEFLKDDKKEYT